MGWQKAIDASWLQHWEEVGAVDKQATEGTLQTETLKQWTSRKTEPRGFSQMNSQGLHASGVCDMSRSR